MAKNLLLVVDYGDGPEFDHANIEQLAQLHQGLQYGHSDLQLHGVYALDTTVTPPRPVPAEYAIEGARDFDPESRMAYPVVTVRYPDGSTEQAGYAIDGRA